MVAGAHQPLVVKGAAGAFADHRRLRHRDLAECLAHQQTCDNTGHIRYQAFRQIAHFSAGIGDDFLALAVIEFLGNLERLGSGPAEARAAELLQRGQIMQSWGGLPLVLDAHDERSLEALGSRSDRVGVLSPDDPLPGGVSHLKMAASDLGRGNNLKIRDRDKLPDLEFAPADDGQSRRLNPTDTDH